MVLTIESIFNETYSIYFRESMSSNGLDIARAEVEKRLRQTFIVSGLFKIYLYISVSYQQLL